MIPQHAKTDFSHVSNDAIANDATTIVSQMTTNASIFPNPTIPLATVSQKITDYTTVLTAPIYPTQASDLAAARKLLEESLSANAKYVNTIANGDLVILGKSGYPISKLHTPVGDLAAPNSVKVTNGLIHGTFDMEIAIVPHAHGYLFAYTLTTNTDTNPNNWTWRWSSTHKNTFSGFTSGQQYKFAGCGAGSSDTLVWTNAPANKFAQ
jgi:hypothetical protein